MDKFITVNCEGNFYFLKTETNDPDKIFEEFYKKYPELIGKPVSINVGATTISGWKSWAFVVILIGFGVLIGVAI